MIEFQRNAGLPVDGIVGEATLGKLEALRKAESGREGKKIPERDEGYARHDTLAGVVGRRRPRPRRPRRRRDAAAATGGIREKDLTLAPACGWPSCCAPRAPA